MRTSVTVASGDGPEMPPEPARVLAAPFRAAAAEAAVVINGNRSAAFPAAMSVMMVRCWGAATAVGTTGNRSARSPRR